MRFNQNLVHRLISQQIQYSTRKSFQTATALSIRQNPREFPVGNDFSYEEVVKNFNWDVPEFFNFSKDVIDKFAETDG